MMLVETQTPWEMPLGQRYILLDKDSNIYHRQVTILHDQITWNAQLREWPDDRYYLVVGEDKLVNGDQT